MKKMQPQRLADNVLNFSLISGVFPTILLSGCSNFKHVVRTRSDVTFSVVQIVCER